LKSNVEESQLAQTILEIVKEEKPQTVDHLINLTKDRLQIPEKKIIKVILKLQNEKKIGLIETPSTMPSRLRDYVKTQQASWYWLTMAATLVTIVSVFTISENAYPLVIVRYILGAVFILWLPGYTFIKALFPESSSPKATNKSLDTIERTALSMGMSLALVPMVGLVLNYTPWGIRLAPITISLTALTLTFAAAALLREYYTARTPQ